MIGFCNGWSYDFFQVECLVNKDKITEVFRALSRITKDDIEDISLSILKKTYNKKDKKYEEKTSVFLKFQIKFSGDIQENNWDEREQIRFVKKIKTFIKRRWIYNVEIEKNNENFFSYRDGGETKTKVLKKIL